MDHKGSGIRLRVLAGIFLAVMAVFLGVLYDTQVNDYEYYYASSIRTIARPEAVEAARGNLTDRDGKVLASSRPSYNLTFDASLLDGGQDESQALLRLLELCRDRGLTWEDGLPISLEAPFAYRLDALGSSARGRFLTYLREDLEDAAEALGDYLLRHPDLLETVDEDGERKNPADRILASDRLDTDRKKADALLEELTADQLSAALLSGAGLSADRLISLMREDLDVPAAFSDGEARLVLGVQYEIRSRDPSREDPYVLAEDLHLQRVLSEFVVGAVRSESLVVVRCQPGTATGVAGALDETGLDHLLGTVAGTDTVLAVGDGAAGAELVRQLVVKLAQTG